MSLVALTMGQLVRVDIEKRLPNYRPLEMDPEMGLKERIFAEFNALASEIEGFRVDIRNVLNAQYLGTVHVGTYKNETTKEVYNKPGKVVFDTGSNWLTLTSDKCAECDTKVFNSASTTANMIGQDPFTQVYGSATLSGYQYTDNVCLYKKS